MVMRILEIEMQAYENGCGFQSACYPPAKPRKCDRGIIHKFTNTRLLHYFVTDIKPYTCARVTRSSNLNKLLFRMRLTTYHVLPLAL